MRNIKITALLLAVLMVVTAFAGCASKSAVSDLDNKVQEQANALAGIQESLKDLAAAIEDDKGSSELDDIKADVEANKQSVADILAAIEGLKDAVAGATGESEDVKTAINQAGAKIDALKDEYAENKKHYKSADYAAIVEALGAAQAAISTCVTAEAVASVLATAEADLAKYVRVDDSIYAYYVQLKGNITAENEELYEEAKEALKAAKKFYEKANLAYDEDEVDPLGDYVYDEDETPLDLVIEIETNFAKDFADLEDLTKLAKDIVKNIDKALDGDESVNLTELRKDYKKFVKDAKALSEENLALVTNADKLDVLIEEAEKISDAVAALKDEFDGAYPSMLRANYGEDTTIFGEYKTLVDLKDGSHLVYTFLTKKNNKNAVGYTSAIYDEIDSRLEKLADAYDLSEDGLALVVAKYTGNKDYLAKYEADKAMVKAFEAEYEKLADGVFADIADLTEAKLTVSSASKLVEQYKANAKAINDWANALVEAYEDLDKDDKIYTDDEYKAVVLANFRAMVVEAQLVGWYDADTDPDEEDWKHNAEATYAGTFEKDGYYFDLYDFVRVENYTKELGEFLETTFELADGAAKALNKTIKDYLENQATSIVKLVTEIGGYVEEGENEDEEPVLVAKNTEDWTSNKYDQGTIAWFMYEYKTDKYDLSGLISEGVALYEQKLATIEKNVEEAEAALKALMDAYYAILGNKNTVVVTMDNAAAIKALGALLNKVNEIAHVDMVKATLADTTADGIKEYTLESIVADYLAEGQTAKQFYDAVLLSDNYVDTYYVDADNKKDTGAITRLVYKATALEKEANIVASAYKAMKALNSAFGGKAFAYENVNDGVATIAKMNSATYKNLATYGYFYGATAASTEKVTVDNKDKYHASVKIINFRMDNGGFFEYTLSTTNTNYFAGTPYDSADAAMTALWNKVREKTLNGALAIDDNQKFYDFMFGDAEGSIQYLVKNTDAEALNSVLYDRFIPAFALPMLASYLEAKFMINNMGKAYQPIADAKAGWGEPTSNYGFNYIKALVVNMLRVDAAGKINDSRLAAIGNAVNYERLTLAVSSAAQDVQLTKDVKFAHADKTWLSKTYDITVVDYYKNVASGGTNGVGAYENAPATADGYAAHDIDLDKIELDVITIYKVGA